MTLEEAVEILRQCNGDTAECSKCPIGRDIAFSTGDFWTLLLSPCSVLQELEILLAEV